MPRPRSHNEAKIGTLWYNYKGVWEDGQEQDEQQLKTVIQDKKVKVELWIHKTTDDRNCAKPPYPVKETWLELRAPEVETEGKPASVSGSDIEILRTTMWDILDKNFAIKWEDYFLVEINICPPYTGDGIGVEFNFTNIEKGTAHDGTIVMRQYEYMRGTIVKPWPGEFKDKAGKTLACIKDTEENKKGLLEFKKRFESLGNEMKKILQPHEILETLQALAQTKTLPLKQLGQTSEKP